jgi:hypothetical protein
MKARGVTLKQLADALGYKIEQGTHKFFRINYDGYFRYGTYYRILVYKEGKEFTVYCRVNLHKATVSENIVEQNGVIIVIEELINQTINKIINNGT